MLATVEYDIFREHRTNYLSFKFYRTFFVQSIKLSDIAKSLIPQWFYRCLKTYSSFQFRFQTIDLLLTFRFDCPIIIPFYIAAQKQFSCLYNTAIHFLQLQLQIFLFVSLSTLF